MIGSAIYIIKGLVISTFNSFFSQKVDEQSKFTIEVWYFLQQQP